MIKTAVRASAILTDTYVAGNIVKSLGLVNQLILEVAFTKGSLTTAEIKVELSYDDVTYGREVNAATSGATTTLSLNEYQFATAGTFFILVPLAGATSAKVSAKGTGTMTNSLLAINAYIANV